MRKLMIRLRYCRLILTSHEDLRRHPGVITVMQVENNLPDCIEKLTTWLLANVDIKTINHSDGSKKYSATIYFLRNERNTNI